MDYYDPRKLYRSVGRGSRQALELTLDFDKFRGEKHHIIVLLSADTLRTMLRDTPEHFDDILPTAWDDMDDGERVTCYQMTEALQDPESLTSRFARWVDAKRAGIDVDDFN